jgi:hypothetical protein
MPSTRILCGQGRLQSKPLLPSHTGVTAVLQSGACLFIHLLLPHYFLSQNCSLRMASYLQSVLCMANSLAHPHVWPHSVRAPHEHFHYVNQLSARDTPVANSSPQVYSSNKCPRVCNARTHIQNFLLAEISCRTASKKNPLSHLCTAPA